MNNCIVILTDYKDFFGSKQKSPIYRGGMDLPKLLKLFKEHGYEARTSNFSDLNIHDLLRYRPQILFTSSEDKNGLYKSFIEDVIYNLENLGLKIIPSFSCLKAHNNKVAMELLRERSSLESIHTITSRVFGSIEELRKTCHSFTFPVVLKPASGAMSRGVGKANNQYELIKLAKRISRSLDVWHDMMEILRKIKYRTAYHRESFYRSKFIIQNFIPGLENDWKVLVYGDKCFVLYRGNREKDFRASGSGKFIFRRDLPEGLLDFAYGIKEHFRVPNISLDIGFDGKTFHLIEFQFLYYGTTTVEKSPFWFEKYDNSWLTYEGKSDLEEVYVKSVVDFINIM